MPYTHKLFLLKIQRRLLAYNNVENFHSYHACYAAFVGYTESIRFDLYAVLHFQIY